MRISDWSSDVCSSDLRARRDPYETRIWAYSRADGGNSIKGILAEYGLSIRDPTSDKRVIEYCLAVPVEEFIRGGVKSEERRVGQEWVSTCRSWWSPYH